jgi:hypothetical protein
MLKQALPFLLALALAGPASAATYWVSPTGATGNSGADSTANAKTLAWFNANALAGDVCRFKSGTYSTGIAPARDGTAASRIRYYGFPESPGAVTVTSISFGTHDYVTARWFNVSNNGGVSGSDDGAIQDSIACVTATTTSGIWLHGDQCTLDSLTLTGGNVTGTSQYHWIDMYHVGDGMGTNNLVSNCTFAVNVNTTASQGDVHILGMRDMAYNTFFRNTFNITVQSCFGYFFPIEMYMGYYNLFQENTWNLAMNSTPGGTHAIWGYRDSSSYNRFVKNTVVTTGNGAISLGLSQSGSFPGSTGHTYLGGNVFKFNSVPGTGGVYWQNGSRGDTLEFNTVAVNGGAAVYLEPGQDFTGTIVRHNTLFSTSTPVLNLNTSSTSGSRLSSNIFYSTSANGAGTSATVVVPSGVGVDSLGLVFSRGGSASNGIRYGGGNGTPGSGGSFGIAGKAAWNTPMFTDSSYATLNTNLLANSPAQNASFQDGYAGARGIATADLVRPAPVTTLLAAGHTSSTVALTWSAVGDDSLSGTASSYEVRYSTSAITSGNFTAATLASGAPTPHASGSAESMTVGGLPAGTTYFFALIVRDEAGNASALSNVVSAATDAADTTPPAAIQDLSSR